MSAIFVNRETRTISGELEEHAARFLEVDRLEPEAIDDGCRLTSAALHLSADRELVRFVVDAPREVVNAADTPRAAPRVGARLRSQSCAP